MERTTIRDVVFLRSCCIRILCATFVLCLSGCSEQVSNNLQSEKLRKRALRNQAKLGLAFLHQAVSAPDFENKDEALAKFKELIAEETNVSRVYEFGWLLEKDSLENAWLSQGGLKDSLAWKNYKLLKGMCPHCPKWNAGMVLMAVGNLDDDPDIDVWTMDQTRTFVHLMED